MSMDAGANILLYHDKIKHIYCTYLLLHHTEPVPVVRPRRALVKVPIQGRQARGPGPLVVGVHVLWEAGEPDRELGLLHLLIC